ncbi:MAG: capsular polysaccharide biosynthesis protein, partial [Pseudomonadota bacterium]
RLWKRRPLTQFFGAVKASVFLDQPDTAAERAAKLDRPTMVWAGKPGPDEAANVEDGFLRSKGLGAELTPPLSLVIDDLGIYYDPTRESRLEHLIGQSTALSFGALERAARLRRSMISGGLSKYNLGGGAPDLPAGHRILVPGQVEDDASIQLGADAVKTNLGLLRAARAANPDAVLIYKPHPDVEAGLRPGKIAATDLLGLADAVAEHADPVTLLAEVQEVWTMTSLLGFEALLRGIPVTCLGTPFYCGWGLTRDQGRVPARRRARPTLDGLVHAALIDYPRYYDPVTKTAAPVEVIVERLLTGTIPRTGLPLRLLAKAQGALASQAHLWR